MKELSKVEKDAYDRLRETLELSENVDLWQVLLNANTRINRLQDENFKQKQKLNALKRLAKTLVHNDRTCSLEAQGFSQVECAEIATEDSIASKLLGIIRGVGELKKDIAEDKEDD